MITIDGHVHTYPRSLCSTMTAEEAVEAAIGAGMDGLVLTEHDCLWTQGEVETLQNTFKHRIIILAGMEASCREGHFLVFGLKDRRDIFIDMPAAALIDIAHQRGAAVVVAHPYRFSRDDGNHCYSLDIDGVEVDSNNTKGEAQGLAERLAQQKKLFRLVSSDAHAVSVMGKYLTSFPDSIKTIEDLAAFIRNGKRHSP